MNKFHKYFWSLLLGASLQSCFDPPVIESQVASVQIPKDTITVAKKEPQVTPLQTPKDSVTIAKKEPQVTPLQTPKDSITVAKKDIILKFRVLEPKILLDAHYPGMKIKDSRTRYQIDLEDNFGEEVVYHNTYYITQYDSILALVVFENYVLEDGKRGSCSFCSGGYTIAKYVKQKNFWVFQQFESCECGSADYGNVSPFELIEVGNETFFVSQLDGSRQGYGRYFIEVCNTRNFSNSLQLMMIGNDNLGTGMDPQWGFTSSYRFYESRGTIYLEIISKGTYDPQNQRQPKDQISDYFRGTLFEYNPETLLFKEIPKIDE